MAFRGIAKSTESGDSGALQCKHSQRDIKWLTVVPLCARIEVCGLLLH
jgi:hypothetical protein